MQLTKTELLCRTPWKEWAVAKASAPWEDQRQKPGIVVHVTRARTTIFRCVYLPEIPCLAVLALSVHTSVTGICVMGLNAIPAQALNRQIFAKRGIDIANQLRPQFFHLAVVEA